jgi:hypothetical protein
MALIRNSSILAPRVLIVAIVITVTEVIDD